MKRRNCEEALRLGLDRETCHNFRGVRQYVMCRAWEKESQGVPFSEAISSSWDEAVEACRLAGGSPGPEEKPSPIKTADLLDPETRAATGKVVLADGELSVCFNNDCTTTRVADGERVYYMALSFYSELGYGIRERY